MKSFTIWVVGFLTCSVLIGACKKDSEKHKLSNLIVGRWELRRTSAAMNPSVNNFDAGNGNILKFTTTGYKIFTIGQLVKSGQYAVLADETVQESVCLTVPEDEFRTRIVYDQDFNAAKTFIKIKADTLTFIAGCYAVDAGHTSEYERLKDN